MQANDEKNVETNFYYSIYFSSNCSQNFIRLGELVIILYYTINFYYSNISLAVVHQILCDSDN